ncbi:MAG: hypothetical protein LBD97_07615 [Bifidobacteriaceae bacterium]|nr:hypothetical protein [Bifidobacteriaceae bacterium]
MDGHSAWVETIQLSTGLAAAEARQLRRHGNRLIRGVYSQDGADPAALTTRARAVLAVSPAGSAVTGVTTFALGGVDLPGGSKATVDQRIHVFVPHSGERGPRRAGVVAHRRAPHCAGLTHRQSGVSAASWSHSWVDAVRHLAREQSWAPWPNEPPGVRGRFESPAKRVLLEAVQLGDALIRRKGALTELSALAACVAASNGPGSSLVRHAFELVRDRTDSFTETWTRLVVWDAGFPDPVVNHEVWLDSQERFFLDLAWPDRKIALEYQGADHFRSERQAFDDQVRRGILQAHGWTVVQVAYRDLSDPHSLLRQLARAFGW